VYVLDTNAIIYYTDDEPAAVAALEPLFAANHPIYISTLTELGRVDELFDDNPHGNKMYQSQKGLAQFLIARGNASKLLEIVEESFDLLTELVEVFIIV
jgi:predicted nucleic acid-binding protein